MIPATLRSHQLPAWSVVAAQDVGRVRTRQEDAWAVLPSARFAGQAADVFAVFDGLGGEPNGQAAAQAAHGALESCLLQARHVDDVLPALEARVEPSGGMTTAVVGVFPHQRPGLGWILTAGDSAAYVSARDRFQLVVKKDRANGAITSCLGGGTLVAHSTPVQFARDTTFLLCTDGVDDVVGVGALSGLATCGVGRLEATVRAVYAQILDKGAPDNATLIVARSRRPE